MLLNLLLIPGASSSDFIFSMIKRLLSKANIFSLLETRLSVSFTDFVSNDAEQLHEGSKHIAGELAVSGTVQEIVQSQWGEVYGSAFSEYFGNLDSLEGRSLIDGLNRLS